MKHESHDWRNSDEEGEYFCHSCFVCTCHGNMYLKECPGTF